MGAVDGAHHGFSVWLLRPLAAVRGQDGGRDEPAPGIRAEARPRGHGRRLRPHRRAVHPPFGQVVPPRAPDDPILSGVELNFAGKAQILGFCGGVEALNYFIKKGDKYKPGDLLGAAYYVADEEDELWVSYQEKELNNGRLAMVAFAGFITQYGLYGNVDDMLFKPMLKPASELTCYGWLCV